ncbi:unnamed protein product [Amoebophrya sp. A120]|nr:unnamed protein product [Amoebophrya sp. A120]|eukprot:GSA120T00023004001.1
MANSRNPIQITKKRRFFDGYADIANTSRKSIVLPSHDSTLEFEWELGDVKPATMDREPVTIYEPMDLEEYGIAVNARLLTMNGIDTSILTRLQVEELLRQRPLTMRFATKKIQLKTKAEASSNRHRRGGGAGGGYHNTMLSTGAGAATSSSNHSSTKTPVTLIPAEPKKNEMVMVKRLASHQKTAWAGLTEKDDAREARRRRFEGGGDKHAKNAQVLMSSAATAAASSSGTAATSSSFLGAPMNRNQQAQLTSSAEEPESDDEEVVTVGPVTGKSLALEKSYLRLTSEAKATDVRPVAVLKEAFARLETGAKEKSWNYVSDQLRAIRQDLLVQNLGNTEFAATVYSANAIWALHYRDLGQFHQCAMQLKAMTSATATSEQDADTTLESKGKDTTSCKKKVLPPHLAKEFRILRAVYNAFMGLDHIKADLLHPTDDDPGILLLVDSFRLKQFPRFFRLRKKCTGPLGDLCSCFDNLFRCEALLRFLACFKIEKPNVEVLSWYIGESEEELARFFSETARLKDWATRITKPLELAEELRNSVAMNIRHQMK